MHSINCKCRHGQEKPLMDLCYTMPTYTMQHRNDPSLEMAGISKKNKEGKHGNFGCALIILRQSHRKSTELYLFFPPPHLCFQSHRSLKLFASWGEAKPCEHASFLIHCKIWFCFLSFLNFSCTLPYFSHADDGWASGSRSCCGYRVHIWGSL